MLPQNQVAEIPDTGRHERSRCGGGRFRVRLDQLLWLPG